MNDNEDHLNEDHDAWDARHTKCPKCDEQYQVVRPGKIQPSCSCEYVDGLIAERDAALARAEKADQAFAACEESHIRLENEAASLRADCDSINKLVDDLAESLKASRGEGFHIASLAYSIRDQRDKAIADCDRLNELMKKTDNGSTLASVGFELMQKENERLRAALTELANMGGHVAPSVRRIALAALATTAAPESMASGPAMGGGGVLLVQCPPVVIPQPPAPTGTDAATADEIDPERRARIAAAVARWKRMAQEAGAVPFDWDAPKTPPGKITATGGGGAHTDYTIAQSPAPHADAVTPAWATIAAGLMAAGEEHFDLWWRGKGAQWSAAFPGWLASEHCGDCTKQPATCMRCMAEEYAPKAKAIAAALGAAGRTA